MEYGNVIMDLGKAEGVIKKDDRLRKQTLMLVKEIHLNQQLVKLNLEVLGVLFGLAHFNRRRIQTGKHDPIVKLTFLLDTHRAI